MRGMNIQAKIVKIVTWKNKLVPNEKKEIEKLKEKFSTNLRRAGFF